MGITIKRNLAERAREIAFHRNLPIGQVEMTLRDFLKGLEDSAIDDGEILLHGITSITVYENVETGEFSTRGRVSPSLQDRLVQAKQKRLAQESQSVV